MCLEESIDALIYDFVNCSAKYECAKLTVVDFISHNYIVDICCYSYKVITLYYLLVYRSLKKISNSTSVYIVTIIVLFLQLQTTVNQTHLVLNQCVSIYHKLNRIQLSSSVCVQKMPSLRMESVTL